MALMWGRPFFLVLAAALAGICSGISSDSLNYFITSVSEPGQQVPQFSSVGYVNDQEFVSYDASTKRYLPKVPWIRKVEKYFPKYWERNSEYAQGHEPNFQDHLVSLPRYYNQSREVHTIQLKYGCELRYDGSTGGCYRYAYNGKDSISFDKETLTWTAADVPAQNIKRKWDADSLDNRDKKTYLEETCIVWLQRYLDYGKEMLQRTEVPEVNVTRKKDYDGMETFICRVGGFYPKEIDITWTKDGEVWMQDTYHGLVSPNSDGTYYAWWSVMVDPKERERYKCHVEHDGLPNPVDVAWEELDESASNLKLIIIIISVGALLLVAGFALFAVIFKKCQGESEAAAASDQGSNSSGSETTETSTNDGPGPSLAHTSNTGNSENRQDLSRILLHAESTANPADDGPGHGLSVANSGYWLGLEKINQRLLAV